MNPTLPYGSDGYSLTSHQAGLGLIKKEVASVIERNRTIRQDWSAKDKDVQSLLENKFC